MKTIKFILAAISIVALVACQKEEESGDRSQAKPPVLLSSVPENGAEGITGTSVELKLEFDVNVMCPTSERNRITVDNEAAIYSIDAYMKEIVLTVSGLDAGKTYTVDFPEGTVIGYNDNPVRQFSIKFSTRSSEPDRPQEIDEYLVTPDPIPNASRLYEYLRSIYGEKTLSGSMAKVSWNIDEAEWVKKWTGSYPAIAVFDYIHLDYSPADWIDYGNIATVKEWFDKGGIVSAGWHWNVPVSKGSQELSTSADVDFSAAEAVKEGTWENSVIKEDLEKIAEYLLLLQAENIPVIWRPMHEAAGNTYTEYHSGAWFWWGKDGAEAYVSLWRYVFDYFSRKGLRNLIWVWTTQTSSEMDSDYDFYPGDSYVDIVGKDIYNVNDAADISAMFKTVTRKSPTKMVTLSECGNVSEIGKQWNEEARWLYFMPWYDYDNDFSENFAHDHAGIAWWKEAFDSPEVITLDELPSGLYE